jgi:hypothetical protein
VKAINYSFFVSSGDWSIACASLFTEDGCENAGVLLCGLAKTEQTGRLLAREFIPVRAEQYTDRRSYHLEVSPKFYDELVTRCDKTGLHPVIIHSHPMQGAARYSQSDDYGESRLLPVLGSLLKQRVVASLVITRNAAAGRRLVGQRFVSLEGLRIIGPSIVRNDFAQGATRTTGSKYDRQVRAFGHYQRSRKPHHNREASRGRSA